MHTARVAPEKADFSTRPADVLQAVESMEKRMKVMYSVRVSADEEGIFIEQDNGLEDPDVIQVSKEQVPLLVKWLTEAAEDGGRDDSRRIKEPNRGGN